MLSITSNRPIKDLQLEFSNAFPFLKIEFSVFGPGTRKFICQESYLKLRYSHAGSTEQEAQFHVTPGMKVKELEEKCEELFGVAVRVYRKFGNLWLETTMTRNMSLQQQNDHLSEISLSNF